MYEGIKVASDAVNHAILLKLERYGVSSHSLQRFNSYLTDRKVRVRIGNSFSDEQNTKYGIPQGSIFGPILFIYINDLPRVSPTLKTTLFADYTNFSFTHQL